MNKKQLQYLNNKFEDLKKLNQTSDKMITKNKQQNQKYIITFKEGNYTIINNLFQIFYFNLFLIKNIKKVEK